MYYDLPFCQPADGLKHKPEGLGEVVEGNRLIATAYKLPFRQEADHVELCKYQLTKEQVAKFRSAIEEDWYFNMYYDDLPVYGFIGKVRERESRRCFEGGCSSIQAAQHRQLLG